MLLVHIEWRTRPPGRTCDSCAFFLAEQGTPGVIVEHGPTATVFGSPRDPRTEDYVNGRFG
ncbi:hypothetical protein [Streptomyces sp. NPDC093795]|uniref:hypothetical protein n=1 Tax=Streptomyces sp. NPDC093795 TaxID=3366051 RepID=UPI0038091BFE